VSITIGYGQTVQKESISVMQVDETLASGYYLLITACNWSV
jgi:hypothetical protein